MERNDNNDQKYDFYQYRNPPDFCTEYQWKNRSKCNDMQKLSKYVIWYLCYITYCKKNDCKSNNICDINSKESPEFFEVDHIDQINVIKEYQYKS